MRFKFQLIASLLSLLPVCGCKPQSSSEYNGIEFTVSDGLPVITPVIVKEIPLNSERPIGFISKMLVHNDNIFVYDMISRCLLKFDSVGQQTGIMDRLGSGPGEYSAIDDFDIDSEGNLYILDISRRNILRYDSETLEFISAINHPGIFFSFSAVDSTNFYVDKTGDRKGVVATLGLYDVGENEITHLFPIKAENEHKASGSNRTHFWRSGNDVIYYERFSPNFYKLTADSVIPYMRLITDDIPSVDEIPRLVQATVERNFNMFDHASSIMDVSYAYKTDSCLVVGLNYTPLKHLYKSLQDGKVYEVSLRGLPQFYGAVMGASAVWNGKFVTHKETEGERNPSLVIYHFPTRPKEVSIYDYQGEE